MLSEVEQTIRLDSHPSLVKTPETQAGAGAGSIIHMPDNLDPGLKPYMLEFNGASVDSIYKAIEHAVQSIDKMAHTGGVRSTQSDTMSGIAMQTEFQLLNAKLSEKADNLELTEESIWKLFALYQGTEWSGEIEYPDSFSIHDESAEFANLARAKTTATGPEALALIDSKLIQLLESETEVADLIRPTNAANRSDQIKQMIMAGLTDAEILQQHPEITSADILTAKQSLLELPVTTQDT